MTDRDRDGRVDLTALPLVTIDGETAKDFDDAVYCERKGKGFRLDRRDRRRLALRHATATRSTATRASAAPRSTSRGA